MLAPLGITEEPITSYCLRHRDWQRNERLKKSRLRDSKLKRKQKEFTKTLEPHAKDVKAREKRIGCSAGVAVAEDKQKIVHCEEPGCGRAGHATKRSAKCIFNKNYKQSPEHDANDQELLEHVGFDREGEEAAGKLSKEDTKANAL